MALSSGSQIGPYTITSPLGAGGMGEVYRARDTRLGRDVALKVLPASSSTDPDRLQRFEQEARATAALNHPNILALYDIGRSEGGPFIVTELLEGQTLRDSLERGAMPVRKALEYAVQIARGLAAAHERGIVHRDLKPDNVFVTSTGHVKILDFGLAKLVGPEPALADAADLPTMAPPTTPGVVLGTVGYMSPEQVLGRQADHRADIFAFGALLYEMVTGRRAFQRDTPPETMTAILKEEPLDISTGVGAIPPTLQRIVTRCLEKNPSARFQSTGDLAFALETLSQGPASATTASVAMASATATPSSMTAVPARARRRISWVIAPASLIVMAAGAWFYARPVVSEARVIRFEVSPPEAWRTDLGGVEIPVAVAPDGRSLAGRARNDRGERALWVRALDRLEERVVAGTENATSFFWSPDSRTLAFFADGKLKKVDIAGGAATVLCDAADLTQGGAWSPSGVILFGSIAGLQQVPSAGGTPTTAMALASDEAFHILPVFLPDGERFVFMAGIGSEVRGGARRRVLAARLGSEERTLLFDTDNFVSPVGMANGQLLFVRGTSVMAQPFDEARLALTGDAVSIVDRVQMIPDRPYGMASVGGGVLAYVPEVDTNTHQLAWYDRAGRQTALVGERGNYSSLELSPDETGAVVAVMDPARRTRDIWLFDMARAIRTRFTFDAGEERTAIWSPNGDRLIFNAQRKGTERDLHLKASNGSGTESTVVADGLSKDAMSWSPDGRVLLYRVSAKTRNDIWVQPLDGQSKPYPFLATEFDENYGRFSPDGRWVVYSSDESGRWEIYVAPFPGPGGKWQLSTAGGSLPRWRQDGREVFYLAPDNTVMSVTVDGTRSGFQVHDARPLFHAPMPPLVGYHYAVTRDGQRFLVNTTAEPAAPVAVIDGWPALVRK
jgi:Tol biopolymer transport system component